MIIINICIKFYLDILRFRSSPLVRRPDSISSFLEGKSLIDDRLKYIKKSEVVPPVCPKCPDTRSCPRPKPCQPCPPCGRCPEPAFECKKVPNYTAATNSKLPRPFLNDFSQFT